MSLALRGHIDCRPSAIFTLTDGTTPVSTPPSVAITGGAAGILAAVLGAVLVRRVSAWQDAAAAA